MILTLLDEKSYKYALPNNNKNKNKSNNEKQARCGGKKDAISWVD